MARLSLNLHRFPPCLQIPQPSHIIANPLQRHNTHKIKILACQTNPNLDKSSTTDKSVSELSNIKGTSSPKGAPPKFPSKDFKKKIAIVSFLAAFGLFLSTRLNFGVSLKDHCAHALPYEEVLPNGKNTVVEFYGNWCEACGELAPDVYKVEQQYKDLVNFVLLNVDNTKYEQELHEQGL